MIQNFVFFHGDEENVHLILGRFEKLIAQIDVSDVKWNVLAGFGMNSIVKLFLAHQRHGNALYDDRVAGNRRGNVFDLDFLGFEYSGDFFRDGRRVHDGAVNDGVLRQRLESEANKLKSRLRFLQLNGFDRT